MKKPDYISIDGQLYGLHEAHKLANEILKILKDCCINCGAPYSLKNFINECLDDLHLKVWPTGSLVSEKFFPKIF